MLLPVAAAAVAAVAFVAAAAFAAVATFAVAAAFAAAAETAVRLEQQSAAVFGKWSTPCRVSAAENILFFQQPDGFPTSIVIKNCSLQYRTTREVQNSKVEHRQ